MGKIVFPLLVHAVKSRPAYFFRMGTLLGLSEKRIESAVRLSWGNHPIELTLFAKLLEAVRIQQ